MVYLLNRQALAAAGVDQQTIEALARTKKSAEDAHDDIEAIKVVPFVIIGGGAKLQNGRTLTEGNGVLIVDMGAGQTVAVALDPESTLNVDHKAVTLSAGAGLKGGGDITKSRTLEVGEGAGITVSDDGVALDDTHPGNVDHSAVVVSAGEGLTGGGDLTESRELAVDKAVVATLIDAQTLSNKTLDAPVITGGSINSTPIGADAQAPGDFTAIRSRGGIRTGGTANGSVQFDRSDGTANLAWIGWVTSGDALQYDNNNGGVHRFRINGSTVMDVSSSGIHVPGAVRCSSLRIDQAATASAASVTHKVPVNINGSTFYLLLSNT